LPAQLLQCWKPLLSGSGLLYPRVLLLSLHVLAPLAFQPGQQQWQPRVLRPLLRPQLLLLQLQGWQQ
jgi:hypothetical protein